MPAIRTKPSTRSGARPTATSAASAAAASAAAPGGARPAAPEDADVAAEARRPQQIADRIVDAILARRLAPGARLGEQPLADLFGVSRTIVREALTRLAARGMVEVNSRRGWFVVQPSGAEARDAFATRRVIETGLLQGLDGKPPRPALKRLRDHVSREQAAIAADDAGERSFLLGDFHVCLAECLGNPLLAEILRDLTARTTLIASMVQTREAAVQSCSEHDRIVQALARGDLPAAVALMAEHIGTVASTLGATPSNDPLDSLRAALVPRPAAGAAATAPPPAPVDGASTTGATEAQALHTRPARNRTRTTLFTRLVD